MIHTETESQVSDEVKARAAKIQVLLMDVDGVMTDGTLSYLPGPDGGMVEFKSFNTQDGLGLHFCNRVGLTTGVISGRISASMEERARILNMKYVYQGHLEKIPLFEEILADAKVSADQVCFIGDDLTDVPLIKRSGLGVAVANARKEVKGVADMVTRARGGEGAVREVIELILRERGLWDQVLKNYELA